MILCADYPDNHVISAVSRGDKWRAATATLPVHTPSAWDVDGRRISRSNAESQENGVAVVVGAQRDMGALLGPIGGRCLNE